MIRNPDIMISSHKKLQLYYDLPEQFNGYTIQRTFSERVHLCTPPIPAEIVAAGASVSRGKFLTERENLNRYVQSYLKGIVKPELEEMVLANSREGEVLLLNGPNIDIISTQIVVRGKNPVMRILAPEFLVAAEYFATMNATVYRKGS